jgi:putative transposase
MTWDVSILMEADFCVRMLDEALARHGKPEIFNTDQGSQFTSLAFTERLKSAGIAISMDGRGRWMDRRVRREAVAQREVRGGLPARL